MTIPTTIAASGPYTPNGVTTAFPFAFKALSDTDVTVVMVSASGDEEIISSASYDVTLAAGDDPGGTVTMLTAPAADGRELWIYLDPTFLQEIKFEDEGPFNQSILNTVADQAGLRSVWLRGQLSRALIVPRGQDVPSLNLADANGKALALVDGEIVGVDNTAGAAVAAATQVAQDRAYIETIYGIVANSNVQTLAADLILQVGDPRVQRLTPGAANSVFLPDPIDIADAGWAEFLIYNTGPGVLNVHDAAGSLMELLVAGQSCAVLVTPFGATTTLSTATRTWSAFYAAATGTTLGRNGKVALSGWQGTTRLALWLGLASGVVIRARYDNDDPTRGLSRRLTIALSYAKIWRATDATKVGTFGATLTSSTTGATGKYLSNTASQSGTTASTWELAVNGNGSEPYDLYASYTQRTSGGYVKPTIDGAQALLDAAIVDPAALGFKAWSTYGAVDLTRRQYIKIASGLVGAHTVKFEVVGAHEAASSGNNVVLECVFRAAALGEAGVFAPQWATGQTVAAGDERFYAGRFYFATTGGVTGATPPTHTAGTVSDGTVSWSSTAGEFSSYWPAFKELDYASETEEAVVTLAWGAYTDDFGGQTHGDSMTNRVLKADGNVWTWSNASYITYADQVDITEDTAWKIGPTLTIIASGSRALFAANGLIRDHTNLTTFEAFTIKDAYGAMLPFTSYDGSASTGRTYTSLYVEGNPTAYDMDDYGGANVAVDFPGIYSAAIAGDMGTFIGTIAQAVRVRPVAVNGYQKADAIPFCHMNLNSITTPPSGATDWQAKLYFVRSGGTPEPIGAGESLAFGGEWVFGSSFA